MTFFKAVVIARHEAIYSVRKALKRLLQSMKNRFRNDETSMVGTACPDTSGKDLQAIENRLWKRLQPMSVQWEVG